MNERMAMNGPAQAGRRRRRLILIGVAAVLFAGGVASWVECYDRQGKALDYFRMAWEQDRRAFDHYRRAFEDRRRAWEQRRRAEEQARRQANAPAPDASGNPAEDASRPKQ
jgi:hypothetical protein